MSSSRLSCSAPQANLPRAIFYPWRWVVSGLVRFSDQFWSCALSRYLPAPPPIVFSASPSANLLPSAPNTRPLDLECRLSFTSRQGQIFFWMWGWASPPLFTLSSPNHSTISPVTNETLRRKHRPPPHESRAVFVFLSDPYPLLNLPSEICPMNIVALPAPTPTFWLFRLGVDPFSFAPDTER